MKKLICGILVVSVLLVSSLVALADKANDTGNHGVVALTRPDPDEDFGVTSTRPDPDEDFSIAMTRPDPDEDF